MIAPAPAPAPAPRWLLPAILLLALALRLAALAVPSIHHPDEIFQYLEPAHRIVFGYGAVPWEAHYGLRSPLIPALFTGPMAAGEALDPGGGLYLLLPRLAMVLASLAVPLAGWMLGIRTSRTHAAMAALVGATWAEFVYFAPHTLSENLAIAAAMPAVALLARPPHRRSPRAVALAGLLLGFATLVRFQFAPALAVVAIAGCGTDRRRWAAMLAGGLAAVAAGGAIDLAAGTMPFGWLVENIRQNLLQDRAAQYGTLGPLGYVTWFEHMWGAWLLPIALLVRLGMKRQPALFWAAAANLVFHSLIAHKEYRFVEFSAVAFVLLAAIGTVDALAWLERHRPRMPFGAAVGVAALLWLAASASMAGNRAMRANWTGATDTLAATAQLRRDPALCGVALLPDLVEWGGYSYLHRHVPVSYFDRNDPLLRGTTLADTLRARTADFNRVVAARGEARALPPGYRPIACFGTSGGGAADMCVYGRRGGCAPDWRSPFLLDTVFARIDRQMRQSRVHGRRRLP